MYNNSTYTIVYNYLTANAIYNCRMYILINHKKEYLKRYVKTRSVTAPTDRPATGPARMRKPVLGNEESLEDKKACGEGKHMMNNELNYHLITCQF